MKKKITGKSLKIQKEVCQVQVEIEPQSTNRIHQIYQGKELKEDENLMVSV